MANTQTISTRTDTNPVYQVSVYLLNGCLVSISTPKTTHCSFVQNMTSSRMLDAFKLAGFV